MIKSRTILIVLAGLVLLLNSCIVLHEPQIKSIRPLTIDLKGAEPKIEMLLLLNNPNPWGIKLTKLDAGLTMSARNIAYVSLREKLKIKSRSDAFVPLELQFARQDLMNLLPLGFESFFGGKPLPVEIKGSFTLRKFIFKKSIVFSLKENIELNTLK